MASFIDSLHLSFREVYTEVPYLLLLLMSVDKPRPVYGDSEDEDVTKVSGRDMLKLKTGG